MDCSFPDWKSALGQVLVHNAGSNVQGVGINVGCDYDNPETFVASLRHAYKTRTAPINHTPVGERGGPGPTELDTIFHTYVGSNGEGTYKEALEQNEEEYKKCERLYGPMHRDTISKKHNEAFIHAHMGQMDKAEQCMRGIFDACLKELDDETHPCLLATSNKWSLILILRKKYKKAEEYNEIALAGYKSRFGEQNRITLSAKCCRALILDKLGDHEEAEAFYEEAYKGTKFLPDADPDAIFIMYYRALAIHGRDRCGTAGKAYQEALEACEKYLKEHYWGDLNYWEMCLMKDKLQKKAA